jgi:hypothetical protein
MSKALEFIFQDTKIHFLLGNEENVMVNATEMAKAFGKEPKDFLRLDGTKNYIDAYLKKQNIGADVPRYERENLVTSNNKAGTYMARPLALKFAAWLDVDFEIWVFDTIDDLLFGHYKELDKNLKLRAKNQKEIERLRSGLLSNPDFAKLQTLEREERQAAYGVGKQIKNQLDMFMVD